MAGHINNLYNTTFWALVLQGGVNRTQAEEQLKVNINNQGKKDPVSFVLKHSREQ